MNPAREPLVEIVFQAHRESLIKNGIGFTVSNNITKSTFFLEILILHDHINFRKVASLTV